MLRRLASLFCAAAVTALAAGDYAGADSCKSCHPAEFQGQSQSAHARTLAPSAANQPGDWAFGTGLQAISFVSRVDRENYREHGETWYRELNGYSITPGHRNAAGVQFRIFDPAARILRCFACHSTGPLTLDADERIVPHEIGVRCEVCHGPAAAHASDPEHHRPRNPAAMTATALNAFCGQCHRLTLETDEEATDLRDPRNSRNEPRLLTASACFRKTKGGLACLKCHAPHGTPLQELSAYDSACQSCHTTARHSHPVAGRACVECHMPAVRLDHLTFRNHRIAVYAAANPVEPVSAKGR